MEQNSSNVRFILSCNYASQIIDPIQSRCSRYRFTPLSDEAIREQLEDIIENENLDVSEDGVKALIEVSGGDMRNAILSLQAASTTEDEVTEDVVYSIASAIKPEVVEEILKNAVEGNFIEAREQVQEEVIANGISVKEFLSQIHRQVWEMNFDENTTVDIIQSIGETEYRINEGSTANIQLESMLASFSDFDT